MTQQLFKRARLECLLLLILMISSTGLFWLTDLDSQIAAWFYHADNYAQVWPYQNGWPLKWLYDYAFVFILVLGLIALAVYMAGFFYSSCHKLQRSALYIVLVILIGPIFMVNWVFKDHWGRPSTQSLLFCRLVAPIY